jgi:hypothetical protein
LNLGIVVVNKKAIQNLFRIEVFLNKLIAPTYKVEYLNLPIDGLVDSYRL